MLAHKPRRRDFLESAAVPVVAVTARQMLFRGAGVRPGDRVLVQGAAGNVGAYAVQFARAAGAHVIASVLPRDRDEALRLGADEVISIPVRRRKACGELWTPRSTRSGVKPKGTCSPMCARVEP